jgi:4-diphosphocytidyl-2-C-methyl-D-erythritol kinase
MKQFAPSKINLYLHIQGKRPDGFHELETLMAPISIGDDLEIERAEQGLHFTCSQERLSDPRGNLACRAAELFLQEFKIRAGVKIHLDKRVPVGAGLGGGSSDAATTLLILRKLFEVEASDKKLCELAGRLGSDVPFFIYRQPAICKGHGEIVEPIQLKGKYYGLLVHPGFGVSTPWAYQTYAKNPTQGKEGKKLADGFVLRNDLEPAAFSKYLWLPATKKWFQQQPEVFDSMMSGSGSAIFALVREQNHVCALEKRFKAEFGEATFSTPFQVQSAQ